MKRFPNRMQRVLDARNAMLTQCETKLATAERKLQQCYMHQDECLDAIRKHDDIATKKMKSCARDHILDRAWFQHLVHNLEKSIAAREHQTQVVNQRREELKKALVDCKIMENLSARQRKAWISEMQNLEQKEMDENAGVSFGRRSMHAASH